MAKRSKKSVSKSAAIRDFHKKNPNAKPKDIAASLNQSGFKITPQYVSTILSNARTKKSGRRRRAVVRASNGSATSFHQLLAVKKLVAEVGGVKAAQDAIDQFSKLMA
jgi:hypothetical protein